ncbi:carboxyphosphonoenolpyruvate phosphonomutase [Brevibacillus formosus]|uniref:Carboxyphosphonoenolpyruvate phosphonomutase n=1 Tax=Brevibacillus formosus TaxID=54913 RepID=A0A220MJJ4_9BACL|nr:isocitrate lyase/phosphoenolpyruvate mutase family protein [Brevibacillus formosus]ASJ55288.1 carboxyphosphonoenolpyruvate phosphonomutase [Brevibacillus formosus]
MNHIQKFNTLHHADDLLFLGNAWDVLSARSLEKSGFQAIGTTSWGIAASLGYTDGEKIDFALHLAIIKMIVDHVHIPVSADIEAGYGEDSNTIVENVLRTADLGVAGINIEDSFKTKPGLKEIREQASLLQKMRTALDTRGFQGFYINARIDTYFQKDDPFEETISRGKAYVESGASGIFVPGLCAEEEMRRIVQQVPAPLNVLSRPNMTEINKLAELGVKRFSIGNDFYDQIAAYASKSAERLIAEKNSRALYER